MGVGQRRPARYTLARITTDHSPHVPRPPRSRPPCTMPTLHHASQMPLGHKETMAQLQQAIWLADRSAQELRFAACSFASSSSSRPVQDVDVGMNVTAPPRRAHRALKQKQKFVELVMCDFTPRLPKDLPASQ